jgi:prepilin-type processing-associated H-X9-DG protein
LTELLIVTAVLGLVLAAIVPAYRAAQRAGHQHSCSNNLKQIAVALQNYHDAYRRFPPAYHVDATGKPAHSWRALVMPFLMKSRFGLDYRLDEPWDGPNNASLEWSKHNPFFACPAGSESPGMTNYVAIVGKGTAWPGARSAHMANLKDGTMNTIMVVEIAHSDIHWMEPRDLPVEEIAEWLQPGHKPQLLGGHIEGGFVAYADGHVEMLPRSVTVARLQAMVSAAGKD